MDTQDKAEQLHEAIQLIEEAKQIVDEAIPESERAHYRAYGRYGFDQLLGNGNPYNSSLFDLVEKSKITSKNLKT